MQIMKEKIDIIMNAIRGRVSTNLDKLVQQTNSPFTVQVTSFPLSQPSSRCHKWKWTMGQGTCSTIWSHSRPLYTYKGFQMRLCAGHSLLHSSDQQGYDSANWPLIPSLPSRNWANTSPPTLLNDRGTRGPQQACWTLSNEKMKAWGHTWLISTIRPFWLTKPMIKFWSPHSLTGSS